MVYKKTKGVLPEGKNREMLTVVYIFVKSGCTGVCGKWGYFWGFGT
jgi:hypothetical protein